ncbi:hypothetical protein J4E81_010230 [Alternaria sp. BMP 2799]|nr:hypothetical protein J4E81_010230 [Alternaria sp. BMP 2799]
MCSCCCRLGDQSPSGKKKRKARKKPLSATPVPSVGVVERLSNFYNEHIGPKNLEFAFVDSWDECVRYRGIARAYAIHGTF